MADSEKYSNELKTSKRDFESYLIDKNDDIDNLAYALINAFIRKEGCLVEEKLEWDMEIIGDVVEAVEDVLTSRCLGVCHPFYCDDVPCYQSDDCGSMSKCHFRNEVSHNV